MTVLIVKLAGFFAHAAPAYPQQLLDNIPQPFEAACRNKGMTYYLRILRKSYI